MTKFQIIRDILALDNVTAQQKLVLIAFNQYGDEGRNVYPSLRSIAKVCALGYRQVKRHAKTLRDKGYLVPVGKSRLNTVNYCLKIPRVVSVPKVVPSASPSTGHPRPPTTLDNKPFTYPPRVEQSPGEYFDSDLPGTLNVAAGDSPGRFFGQWETVHERSVRLNRERMKRE